MAEDNKMKRCPVTLQPDIEELLDWNNYSADDFDSASQTEKKDFIQERQSVSYWKDAWRRLKKNVVAMVALGVIIFLVLFAFVGPYLVPYGYDQFNKGAENLHPTHYTLEDTQKLDAELAARTSAGGTKSAEEMIAEAEAEAAAKGEKLTSVDIAKIKAKAKVAAQNAQKQNEEVDVNSLRKELGVKKHLFGYSTDELQRKANGEKVFPHVFGTDYVNTGSGPLKSFVSVLGPNLISMFIAFGMLYWVTMSRIIRGQVLQLKQQEYVTAARALGASGKRIILRHLIPNCIGQIVVTTCLQIPSAIFLESFLSYLGVGVSAPLPSLGSMATDALSGMYTYTYRLIIPSVILSIMILAFNLFGDGLRDALDPKLKK